MKSVFLYTAGASEAERPYLKDGWSVYVKGGSNPEAALALPNGIQQAQAIGQRWAYLRQRGIVDSETVVASSAELSARGTLEIALGAAGLELPTQSDPRLNEIDNGSLRTWPIYKVGMSNGGMAFYAPKSPEPWRIEKSGAEPPQKVILRMQAVLDELTRPLPKNGTALAVSHPQAINHTGTAIGGFRRPLWSLSSWAHASETLLIRPESEDAPWQLQYLHLPLIEEANPPIRMAYWHPERTV